MELIIQFLVLYHFESDTNGILFFGRLLVKSDFMYCKNENNQ